MISAIQNKLQKHNKVVFFVLLAVIIVAFVFTIGAAPGLGEADERARQDYFGYNLASERDQREIVRMGEISYRMEYGDEQPDPNRFQNFALERIAYLGLADKLRIPGPTDDQIRRFVSGRQAFQDDEGNFDPNRYNAFIDDVEADPQTSTNDVGLILEQDFRVEEARELLAGPGYVLPTEVRLQLERNQTLWSMDLATLNLADLEPEVDVTEEELEAFYEENSFRYEREERVSFSYALFPREAFVDDVELTEDELQSHFQQNRDQFAPPPSPDEVEEGGEQEREEVTLAGVRDEVEKSLRLQKARRLAGNAASDFAYALFNEGERPGSDGFQGLLERFSAELHEAPPASPDEFPAELGFPQQAQKAVFRLNEDRDFSDPISLNGDYIVLIYEETLPSYVPPLDEVRQAVQRDYEAQERRRLLSEKGEEIRSTIRDRMEEGASFREAAEAEGLEVRSAERFSRISPPPEVNRELVQRLDDFEEGKVSPMISLQNFGYFVFITDREVPEIDRTSDEFVRTKENLQMWSSMSQNSLLQEFVGREIGVSQEEDPHAGHDHGPGVVH